ncbi:MAG: hypothetical protein ACYTGR_07180 [Planctomycetota bacterium]|jgi:hypothetical protein
MSIPASSLVARASLVTFACLLVAGCGSPQPVAESAPETVAPPPVVEPDPVETLDVLTGTSWRVTGVVGDIAQTVSAATLAFEADGMLRVTIVRQSGAERVDTRRYEVEGNTLRMSDTFGMAESTFARFGDELTIEAPTVRIALRQVSGRDEGDIVVEGTRAPVPIDHPIAGTRWELVSVLGDATGRYLGGTFEFTRDGRIVMSLQREDGTSNPAVRRYRMASDVLMHVLDDLGQQITMTVDLSATNLALDTPQSRILLQSAE